VEYKDGKQNEKQQEIVCNSYGDPLLDNLSIAKQVEDKLSSKHGLTIAEVRQAFVNREGGYLEDDRDQHRTDPPSQWFVAPTNHGRVIKVVFVHRDGKIVLKTAYDANPTEARIYERHAL
jgi:uncharacterized DUF497 family protein